MERERVEFFFEAKETGAREWERTFVPAKISIWLIEMEKHRAK